ncbi:MAG: molecular chaperone HtpG [Chloroflexota bacterium]
MSNTAHNQPTPIAFKAETRQLLNILIHSLYTEREVFLRELISNAADALTRVHFESLTNRKILDPESELGIWIETKPAEKILTIRDSGIGMNSEDLAENLGTIAHSGAKAFLQAAQQGESRLSDIIGQFGVGFYSAFMVAERIEVVSRSCRLEDTAAKWISSGEDTFTIEPVEKTARGTLVTLHLKEDALEFCEESRLRQIIKKHSDYIPYPIYLNQSQEAVNRQTSLWRQPPSQVSEEQYHEFFKQFTLDFRDPLLKLHLSIDAPVQLYALLFVPASAERSPLALRKEEGLKLYARKVLIQEYCKDLLPASFHFVDGVVDSEDLPLNISRESIQSNRVMGQLKRILTNKVIDMLKGLAQDNPEDYTRFWENHGRSIRETIATDPELSVTLQPLLRYRSLKHKQEWISLDDYLLESPANQTKIYYLSGDNDNNLINSPHLDVFRDRKLDVLFMTDPLDAFVLLRMNRYSEHDLVNAANEDLQLPETVSAETKDQQDSAPNEDSEGLISLFKSVLGERIGDARPGRHLTQSPLRLVIPSGGLQPELQKVYRLLDQKFEPPKPIVEFNPLHPILISLASLDAESSLNRLVVEQLFENALLIEGLHPDPASMTTRIQHLIESALLNQKETNNDAQ